MRITIFQTPEDAFRPGVKKERPDGALVVYCGVGQYEGIRYLLKSWIPNILIIEPEDFKNSLLMEMKQWIERQEKE